MGVGLHGVPERAGTLAGELAPSITKYADDFSGWFASGGRELLVSSLMTFGSGISDSGPTVFSLS
ncbi:hypothetical protein CWR41_22770 [Cedecea lapagei]|nr:hypothetical protein CWR41_22770 [Cedecea lapagei]